jgi:hypothetical protein
MHHLRSALVASLLVLAACGGQGQSLSEQRAVLLTATVDADGPAITLQWNEVSGGSTYQVFRRAMGQDTWGSALAQLPASVNSYTDNDVAVGAAYEYRLMRGTGNSAAYGHVATGIGLVPVEQRGVLLLVTTSETAALLQDELEQLEEDLLGDGWFTERILVEASDSPASVRDRIIDAHASEPTLVKAVYLLVNVPVPYSGNQAPDGHDEHAGSWACDGYYGELDGNWTDASVNNTGGAWGWNHNVPGDGKLDQNQFPSPLELQVGRVDLSRLETFPQDEAQLLSTYLAKAHAFKTGQLRVPERAVIWDNLQWTNYPLAVSGHQAFTPCVGAGNVSEISGQAPFSEHYLQHDDLLTFQAGSGIQDGLVAPFLGVSNGMNTPLVPGCNHGGIFNMSIGSYYGDWDNPENYLRALLADGNALVHVWSGLPNWFLHPLGIGETIGYCALRTLNNTSSDYMPANGGWQSQDMGRIHLGLMGDPSLRLRYTAPPAALVATNDQWFAAFSWDASPDTVDGYLLYRVDTDIRNMERITPEPVQGTSYTSNLPFVPGQRYLVRAVELRTTPSGSYHDLSLGAMATSVGEQIADCEGVIGGMAIPGSPCDDGDPGTTNTFWNTACACVPSATGIPEERQGSLEVWPSPANDRLHVRSTIPGGMLTVRSISGAEMLRRSMTDTHTVLDSSSWPTGSYIVEWRPQHRATPPTRRRVVVTH